MLYPYFDTFNFNCKFVCHYNFHNPLSFGGNVTWIGSSAGVVAVGISLKYGHKIRFISMVQNKISIYDINCCSWFGYTNVNDIVIFVNYYS